ncbi:transposable element Tcb2 transposase [Trichonephila clavipes]|nr:transposable element Tcb2 transposase [Trichonephila clavipes]
MTDLLILNHGQVTTPHVESTGSTQMEGLSASTGVKVSDHGRHVMSSSPVPLKTRRFGERCTLNLSRARTSSRWSSCTVEQFHSDTSLKVVDRRAPNNAKNCQWTTEDDDSARRSTPAPHGGEGPCIFLQAVGSTLVNCYRCSNVAFVNLSASAATWIAYKGAFIQDTLTVNHPRWRLQWAREHRDRQTNWHQVVFSDESRFNLWDHDGCIRVRRYACERCLPECVIELHSGLTLGVKHDNSHPHGVKTVRDFCSAQHMEFLPWPAYSPDMSPIEHVWDFVGRRLAPAASKDEFFRAYKQYGILFYKQTFKICLIP